MPQGDAIRDLAGELPITDVHEHHLPEVLLNRRVGLLDLLRQSYAGWTQARPYALPGESREGDPMLAPAGEASWDRIAPYLEGSGSTAFVRNLVQALESLYDLGQGGLTRATWKDLDAEIRRRHADPAWVPGVLRRARVQHVVTDAYTQPLLDPRPVLGPCYASVCRINALAMASRQGTADHNGNTAQALAARLQLPCERFADFEQLLEAVVAGAPARGQVALKNALAYDREVDFDPVPREEAERLWQSEERSREQSKRFGDWVVDRLCGLAGEAGLPVQVHLGTALIRGSHPLRLAGLVERHPRTRFLLMHLAYPWSSDLLAMAFVYRNVWIDLTWSWLLSPSHFKRAFEEAVELLPDEGRMMLGGDTWHVEETYGALQWARRLIGEVLAAKVESGYFTATDAERLLRRILFENGAEFFGLSG